MLIFWTLVVGALLGYLFGHYVQPNQRLKKAIKEARESCVAALTEGKKGVYRTVVTDHNQSSELIVEVKELAVTQAGQVKVQYLDVFYKNPDFRTKKAEALLREVRDLLGDYLPADEIEWFDNTAKQEHIKRHLNALDNQQKYHFGT